MTTHTLPHIAHTIWQARCADQTADTLETQVICYHPDDNQSRRYRCNGTPPAVVIADYVHPGIYEAIIVVAPAAALVPEGSDPAIMRIAANQRLLTAVSRNGELVTMCAHDGETTPTVQRGGSGPFYADVVMTMIRPGELETELTRILMKRNP